MNVSQQYLGRIHHSCLDLLYSVVIVVITIIITTTTWRDYITFFNLPRPATATAAATTAATTTATA